MRPNHRDRPPAPGGYSRQNRPHIDHRSMTEYYDATGLLRREVFIEWPRQIADTLRISRSNIRRAYDFVAALRLRIQMGEEDPVSVLRPGMGQLYRFVMYQAGRDRAWEAAEGFFQAHINAVGDDPRRFEGFYQLFQSVMAYLKRS